MLYLKTTDGKLRIVVLETQNLDRIKEGSPAHTPDKSVLICWTPDPVWLADKIMECDGDANRIVKLIDECSKRPQKPPRPSHGLHEHHFGG